MPTHRYEPLLFTQQLWKHAEHYGPKTAVIDDAGELSYTALYHAVLSVASGLRSRGIRKGDRVATAMHPSMAHLVVLLGCMAAGAIPCALNIRLTTAELERFLAPIGPTLIIADLAHRGAVEHLGVEILVLADIDARASIRDRLESLWSEQPYLADLRESDLAMIVPTGGTTGIPKGAISSHRSLFLWLSSCTLNAGRTARDVELFFSPFFHVSLMTGALATLFAAGTVRILRAFSADEALIAIERGANFLMGAPTMFAALRRSSGFSAVDRTQIRAVTFGAMAATTEFIEQLMSDYPAARLRHGYGATEFGPVTAMVHEDLLEGRIAGVGRALPGARIVICDEKSRPLPPGEIGELVVSCPWQTLGYWGREEETAATFAPLGVRLGDLGSIDSQGWIAISGRKKEMINTGGENVFPNEVEAVLSRHPAVADIIIYGASDDYWGERVEAAVVLQPGASLTQKELADFGRAQLGGYKLPKRLRIVETLPLTPNNKPDRRRLRQEASGITTLSVGDGAGS